MLSQSLDHLDPSHLLPSNPIANVVEKYQKRQKFSEQRFANTTIIL
jgi:hypothetical protein